MGVPYVERNYAIAKGGDSWVLQYVKQKAKNVYEGSGSSVSGGREWSGYGEGGEWK
jgi:hypothetical protein